MLPLRRRCPPAREEILPATLCAAAALWHISSDTPRQSREEFMKPVRSTLTACLLIALGLSSLPFASPIRAAESSETLTPAQARAAFSRSERLDRLVADTARAAVAKFGPGGLGENKLA